MISTLDPSIPIPTPRLDKDGRLPVSSLTTWCRELADWSQRTGNSDWTRASAVYRASLLAELRERVDWRLASKAKQARADRVAAEDVLHAARVALEEPSQERALARVTGQLPRAERQAAVEQAERALITARTAERDAFSALRQAALPIYQEAHCKAAYMVQESARAAAALIADSKRALRAIEQLDPEQLLLEGHDEH